MIRFLLTFTVAIALSFLAYTRTDGFVFSRVQGALVNRNTPLSFETKEALLQNFHYLGRGRQCFVFQSDDKKYVIKFFDQNYFCVPWYRFSEKEKAKRAQRYQFYNSSYQIAFEEFGEQLLYLHFGPSVSLPIVSIMTKSHHRIQVDLNEIPFVLQRKGISFYSGLEAIYQREGAEGLFREVDSFLLAINNRISRNIADWDQNVENNWGYVDGEIFHLDPGRLYYDETLQE